MSMISRFRGFLPMVLVAMFCATAFSQAKKPPIALRLEPFCPAPRSDAPILIDTALDYSGREILEGTLQLRLVEPGTNIQMLDLRVPDVFVTSPQYRTTLVVPPLPDTHKIVDIKAKFILKDGKEIVLGAPSEKAEDSYLSLLVPDLNQRGLTIGMVVKEADDIRSAKQTFLGKALELQRWAKQPSIWSAAVENNKLVPKLVKAKVGWFAATTPAVDPDLLPTDPLSYCAFDILAMADGGLAALKNKQLEAIKRWVKSGGSLCVVPDGELSRTQAGFVTDLLSEIPDPPALTRDGKGKVVDDQNELFIMTRYGLGRVVVLPPNLMIGKRQRNAMGEKDPSDELLQSVLTKQQLRDVAGFLWKIRTGLLDEAEWSFPVPANKGLDAMIQDRWARSQLMNHYNSQMERATVDEMALAQTTGTIVQQLMPQSVRMVPLWLVATMLIAYVFAVGPGDYLLLGLLKLRRYTWVVFPIVTALFTAGLVGVSNFYMATSQTGGLIEIHDVVDKGQVVRSTAIDLEYYGARRELSEEHQATFVTPMSLKDPGAGFVESSGARTNPYVEGRLPIRYVSNRVIDQWSPQLSRSLTFSDERAPDLGFPWGSPGPIWTKAGQQRLKVKVLDSPLAKEGTQIGLTVFSGKNSTEVLPMSPGFKPGELDPQGRADYAWIQANSTSMQRICELSSRTPTHFFRYVSQISPGGGGNFEDLAILDSTDPNQYLLIASWLDGDTQKVYRRLYHRPDNSMERGE